MSHTYTEIKTTDPLFQIQQTIALKLIETSMLPQGDQFTQKTN